MTANGAWSLLSCEFRGTGARKSTTCTDGTEGIERFSRRTANDNLFPAET